MRYINFFIFTFIFSALCNATDLPDHYTFPQNYKEGTYTQKKNWNCNNGGREKN